MSKRHRASERGSTSLELAVLAPAFLILVGLVIGGGRVALAHQAVEAAATEAARSASIARTAGQAGSTASASATASLNNQDLDCAGKSVSVDTSDFSKQVGTSAQVAATVVCTVPLADLAVPGLPGSVTITKTMTSPIDTYRERG